VGDGEHRTDHAAKLPRMCPLALQPVGREGAPGQDRHQVLRLLDRTRHLRTYIAAAHALEVAPGVDADFVLKPAESRDIVAYILTLKK